MCRGSLLIMSLIDRHHVIIMPCCDHDVNHVVSKGSSCVGAVEESITDRARVNSWVKSTLGCETLAFFG